MTSKLRFSPTFNENVKISSTQNDAEKSFNYQNSIWDSWPVVVKVVCNESSLEVWHEKDEDFGNCFGLTLFGLIPAAVFALVSAYFLAKPSPNIRLPEFPWQIWIKITVNFLISLLLIVHLVSLYLPFDSLYAPPYPALLVTYLFWIIAEVLHLFYLYAFMVPYKLFFKHGPSWMLMSWFLTIPYYAQSIKSNIHYQRSVIDNGVWISILCLKLIYLIAHLCPHSPDFQRLPHQYQRAIRRDGRSSTEGSEEEGSFADRSLLLGESLTASYRRSGRATVSPEVGNTLWTQMTLSWPMKMLRQGARFGINTVEQAMILPRNLKVLYTTNLFGVSELVRPVPLYTRSSSSTSLDESDMDEIKSLWKRIAKVYGFKFAMFGIFQFTTMLSNFAKPLTLSYLLEYMEGDVKDPETGFTYAGILIALTLFEGTLSVHLDYQLQRMKLSLRSALVTSVYEKTILVARHKFEGKTIGEILNLMSTDCDRLANTVVNLHQIWCVPAQVILVLGLLYFQVGYVFSIGLGFSLVMIFVNHRLGKFIGKVNKEFMNAKDARIRLLSDIVYSISFIKMTAMEKIFKKKVEKLRKEEIGHLGKIKYLDAACVYFWAATPVILSIILFTIFSYFGEALTAAKVFTSLSLINLLIFPLNAYPWVINGTMEGYVSLKRLQKMLDLTVIDYQQVYEPTTADDDCALLDSPSMYGLVNNTEVPFIFKLSNASFTSSTNILAPSTVKNINFKVAKGDLVGIAGDVGSGKSSLLQAIAGEIDRTSGSLLMNDNHDGLGLVTQEAWIFNGTVRENIVFGSAYNPELYRKIIEATALVADIESWPAGDLTWLGERGTTISGGQKARIHLARQVYQV
ncbi:Oidioi.mRNA.OKI2018_I69.chr2.g7424.t1.cds [Oikopleura dioica]|uniref:Oidioi.mRNA.OKI2018_I69.chr2.g7424.t1.cds n=1 Tax=Oikopleura dioica TaxID=34765 RepID=A0ABN7T6M6_OIKDI|nr:Oidioi.mRNA.OKI2018_I69.chr2.g7424.t1.cds [Oikopleura dioica]